AQRRRPRGPVVLRTARQALRHRPQPQRADDRTDAARRRRGQGPRRARPVPGAAVRAHLARGRRCALRIRPLRLPRRPLQDPHRTHRPRPHRRSAGMIIAGLMTGTSADGLDIVIAEFLPDPTVGSDLVGADPTTLSVRILADREAPFDPELGSDILRLLEPADTPLSLVSSVDARLGRFAAAAVAELCTEADLRPDLVVSHGQSVRHDISDGRVRSTLQLGQPAFIAERLGVPVLSDVRSRDVAAGGQGAPLVGMLDSLLLSETAAPTAVLNLGGIANNTVTAARRDPIAFDTGPANALIDVLARRMTDGRQGFDRDGALAAAGTVDEDLLADLLTEPFYSRPAPKSTGKELFHADYLDSFLTAHPHLGDHDAIAT